MKTEIEQFENWANAKLEEWQEILLLQGYTLKKIKKSSDDSSKMIFRYPYKNIEVHYAKDVFEDWKNGEKDEAEQVLIHELCHVFTDPLYSKAVDRFPSKNEIEDEREHLVDHITNIIWKNMACKGKKKK